MTENFTTSRTSKKSTNHSLQRKYKKGTTYLGLIASAIQKSPNKMLTVAEIMDILGTHVTGERKGLENNVRVILSINDCLVKVRHCQKNYWKVDENLITMKMARRHFDQDGLNMFPLLSSKLKMHTKQCKHYTTNYQESPVAKSTKSRCDVKFSSPFSIESILKRDSSSAGFKPPSQSVSNATVGFKQPYWQAVRGIAMKGRLNWDSTPVGRHPGNNSNHSGSTT